MNSWHFFFVYRAMLLLYGFNKAGEIYQTPKFHDFFARSGFLEMNIAKVIAQSKQLLRIVFAAFARDCEQEDVHYVELHMQDTFCEEGFRNIARVLSEFETPQLRMIYAIYAVGMPLTDEVVFKSLGKLQSLLENCPDFRRTCVGVGSHSNGTQSESVRAAIRSFAKQHNLLVCPHLGEFYDHDQEIVMAAPHVHRIGHGIRAIDSPDAIAALIKHDVCLEINPICNVVLKATNDLASHPLRELLAAGVKCCINSDDPCLLGATNMADMYRNLRAVCHDMEIPCDQIKEMLMNSWKYSAAPSSMKERAISLLSELPSEHIINIINHTS